MLWADVAAAQGRKPKLPPGLDPGGVAIAILSTGIDYPSSDIAQRLARDGEGELIGWDLVDRDNRPFNAKAADTPAAWGGDGNALLRAIGQPGRRVVPVRIDTARSGLAGQGGGLRRRIRRPASSWCRCGPPTPTNGRRFGMAMRGFVDLLFIVAAGDEGRDIDREPVWPAAFGHGNVLVVSAPVAAGRRRRRRVRISGPTRWRRSSRARRTAAWPPCRAADALAGCWPQLLQRYKGEALKRALLVEAAKLRPGSGTPVIERCGAGGAAAPR